MKPTTKQNSVNLGLYLGATLSFISVLFYAVNLDLMIKWWVSLLSLTTVIVFGVLAAKKAKSTLGGFIDFKGAFTNYFITTAIGSGISTITSIIIFAIIDTSAAKYLNKLQLDNSIEFTKKMMKWFNVPENVMIEEISKLELNVIDSFSIIPQIKGLIFYLAFLSLIGLIVAAITKKTH